MPFTRPVWGGADVVLRTAGPPAAALPAVRRAVVAVDPDVTVSNMSTAQQELDEETAQQRFTTTILGAFSLVALLLASLGLYGVLAYAVRRNGAPRSASAYGDRRSRGGDRAALIVRNAARLAATGLVLGVGGAVVFARAMRSLLFGVTPLDPVTFLGVTAVLGAVALLASYLPARRAAGVDPVTALRSE